MNCNSTFYKKVLIHSFRVIGVILVFSFCHGLSADSGTWSFNNNGIWDDDTHWTGASFPNLDDNAILDDTFITKDITITIPDYQIELATVTFSSTHQYTLTGGDFGLRDVGAGNTLIQNGSGNVLISSKVYLDSSQTWTGNGTGKVTIQGPLDSGSTTDLTKSGTFTLAFSGSEDNTYTGTITVNTGTLELSKTGGAIAITGDLVIGDGIGGANADVVRLFHGNQIANTSLVSVKSSGLLDLNNHSNTVGGLVLEGGNITTGTGTLTLNGDVTGNASSQTATVSGKLGLGGADRTFTIASGSTPSGKDMDVSAVVRGSGGLIKEGAGTLVLSGISPNTFTGSTTINAGTLDLNKTGALGATSSVMLNSGGTLLFSGSSTDRISNSAGIQFNGGTLDANSKTETMGVLTLTSDSVIKLKVDGIKGILTFAGGSYSSGVLTIQGWSGSAYSSGLDDKIIFSSGLSQQFLDSIQFAGFNQGAVRLGSGEICPIPEPGTILSALMLVGLLVYRNRFK